MYVLFQGDESCSSEHIFYHQYIDLDNNVPIIKSSSERIKMASYNPSVFSNQADCSVLLMLVSDWVKNISVYVYKSS